MRRRYTYGRNCSSSRCSEGPDNSPMCLHVTGRGGGKVRRGETRRAYVIAPSKDTTIRRAVARARLTSGISRAINNCHRNRDGDVCRRRRNRCRRAWKRSGADPRATTPSPSVPSLFTCPCPGYMNSHVRPRTCCSRRCFTLRNCRACPVIQPRVLAAFACCGERENGETREDRREPRRL